MLEQNRFLEIKTLAQKIREENAQKFEQFKEKSVDDAIREKEEFIESVIGDVEFSDGDKGKEEKQIFRANILIPDDVEFFQSYSNDKNIRNLMNLYSVGIEDIMSKITELNLYSKFIPIFNEEPEEPIVEKQEEQPIEKHEEPVVEKQEEPIKEEENSFVDDMVDLSKEEADNLLTEIEDIPDTMEELEVSTNEEEPEEDKFVLEPETITEEDNEEKDEHEFDKTEPINIEDIHVALEKEEPNDFDKEFEQADFEDETDEEIEDNFEEEIKEPEIKEEKEEETMEEIEMPEIEEAVEEKPKAKFIVDTPEVEESRISDADLNIEEIDAIGNDDIEFSDEIENISSAVSEFVDEYSKVKRELEFTQAKVDKFNSEKEELRKKLNSSKEEIEYLEKENNKTKEQLEKAYEESKLLLSEKEELAKELESSKDEIEEILKEKEAVKNELNSVVHEADRLSGENERLKTQIKSMEKTVKQSTDLLKEIYKSIPKKRFNVK